MEQERGDVAEMGQAVVCMLGGEFLVGCGSSWVSCSAAGALLLTLTVIICLCRAPGICQAPECELPGCRWVSTPCPMRLLVASALPERRGKVCLG